MRWDVSDPRPPTGSTGTTTARPAGADGRRRIHRGQLRQIRQSPRLGCEAISGRDIVLESSLRKARVGRRLDIRAAGRVLVLLACVVFAIFYLMLALGGASLVGECDSIWCGQLHQATFAAVGAASLFVGAARFFLSKSGWSTILLVGTLPILIVHIILVIEDPNEALFFPISTIPPPVISGAVLLWQRVSRHR